jgi:hypothetical protein
LAFIAVICGIIVVLGLPDLDSSRLVILEVAAGHSFHDLFGNRCEGFFDVHSVFGGNLQERNFILLGWKRERRKGMMKKKMK